MTKGQKYLLTGFVLGILGAVGAYFIAKEQDRIRSLYGDRPQTITVADLAKKGYGDNVWVDLIEGDLGEQYVIESRKGTISAVWVPVFPKGQAKKAKTIQVILRSTRSKSDADIVQRFGDRTEFRG